MCSSDLYHGELVEQSDRETLFSSPQHPYTRTLLDAVPIADPAQERARLRRIDAVPELRGGVA